MIPRPPSSTLFPYTTLFRSSVMTVTAMDPTVLMHLDEKVKAWPNMMDSDVASAIFSDAVYGFTPVVESTKWSRQEDRKSTRLNSSHRTISYAVFCLKKKKKK